ncbi:MAG: hypothetical protein IKB01_14410 [Lachnospiraceae bacterium]|nr:hypothetical protein [Lachnospiraceae bacterium]
MTKKMFQVSRLALVLITFGVCLSLILDEETMALNEYIYERCIIQILGLALFLWISQLYEKKRKVFSTGYIFLLINVFINNTICPCYYTNDRLLAKEYIIHEEGDLRIVYQIPSDRYSIYMQVYFILMAIILIYLLCVKHTTEEIKRYEFLRYKDTDDFAILAASVLIAWPLMEMSGISGVMLVAPTLCYFFGRILYTNFSLSQSLICIAGLILGLYGIVRILDQRYLVIEYIMPIILGFCVFVAVNDNKEKGKKVIPLLCLGIVVVLLYGMVSEIIKLNTYWEKSYDFSTEFTNLKSYYDFAASQVYRIFGIWTILGGNIIEHTMINGYYYGITYIKALAPYLGFEYISLPEISARYIQASYAQPGLLAEGYANFGVIGAVINLLVPFVLAEICLHFFLKKRDGFWLCMLSVPFVKVLLDGGTINSIIVGIGICIVVFSLYLVLRFLGLNIKSIENIRIRVFRKERYKGR